MKAVQTFSSYIILKESRVHGKGVFAAKNIPRGVKVLEYVGEKVTKEESDRRAEKVLRGYEKDIKKNPGVFIFELNKKYDIDGNVPWNVARFVNHSCDPNCEVEIENDSIWIISKREIKKGEEISYNYGYDIDNFEDHPCFCGSVRCIGYILDEDLWPKVRKKIAEREMELNKKESS